ncbi:DNA-methyltransferase [Halococcoides cellulosivorans]|uniref:Type II methyltransferase n=1 Tax=Halococcoides cellulosivorans TaxID=1679096 RepID=A0A2R4WZU0_9EURY|nr:DNA methyltransferase [Halococcoides cellulosivorans]AWB27054.1 modification methylase [Halococcoides cellulosivorans]
METTHRVVAGDARSLCVPDDTVELVVTSPPYPMIEMWDDAFAAMDATVADALEAGDGDRAFEAMHAHLDRAWDELARVLTDGGIVCVVVGDATRSIDGSYQRYANHSRITRAMTERGFTPLPEILWRKPTNSAAKFMGSGMVPPNAYVTLEHEHVLVFRYGDQPRSIDPGADRRYEAAYFWEERNRWFSDVWTDVRGVDQALADAGADPAPNGGTRDRSAAYPLAIPYRLIAMFSVHGDTVLDPFVGTGTTTLAAMAAARNSIGVDSDPGLLATVADRVADAPAVSERIARRRLADHRAAVERARDAGESVPYDAETHEISVRSKQSRRIVLRSIETVRATPTGYRSTHAPIED